MHRQRVDSMIKPFCSALVTLGMLLLLTQSAAALNKPLSWDASPSPDVAGYKIYYKPASATLPLDGIGAVEGDSPIDVGNVLTASLTVPDDGQVYYFAVTAYDAAGYESAYSNIVASGWIPPLLTPGKGSSAEQVSLVRFDWDDAPTASYTYTLYYGTDSQLTAVSPPPLSKIPLSDLQITLLLALLVLAGLSLPHNKRPKRILVTGAATLLLGLSLTGCGGGGGDAGSVGGSTPLPTSSTVVVPTAKLSYYDAYNELQPATTYYWKVVATDDQTGSQYQSLTYNFTTTAN